MLTCSRESLRIPPLKGGFRTADELLAKYVAATALCGIRNVFYPYATLFLTIGFALVCLIGTIVCVRARAARIGKIAPVG